jgi:aryl-phospho-beta-D-glucosidase BglC (GH1 family)
MGMTITGAVLMRGSGVANAAQRSAAPNNLLPSGYLRTQGTRIVDVTGRALRLAGVNWYGFDCPSMVAGGLDHQPLDSICRQIVTLGFNHIRLPFSVQLVQANPPVTRYLDKNPALRGKTALQIMDAVVAAAGRVGLKVVLDCHRSDAGWSIQSNGLWYTQVYPESVWISSWRALVQRYAGNATIIGCDLRNELGAPPRDPQAWPRNGGAVWGYTDPKNHTGQPDDWTAAAQACGNAILEVNPNLLIFVEGVRWDPAGPASNGGTYWPGGNLMGVGTGAGSRKSPVPITLSVPNRLVYSAHDYGPDMYAGLPWGQRSSTQADCWAVWDQTWGFIVKNGIAPIWMGEFGTSNGYKPGDTTPRQYYTDPNNMNPQGAWFTHLVSYLADLQTRYGGGHWCYWCLNGSQSAAAGRDPSQPDWYGVLNPTWSGMASQPLLSKLKSIQ